MISRTKILVLYAVCLLVLALLYKGTLIEKAHRAISNITNAIDAR